MKKLFSEKQEQYIKDHFQTMSYKDIAKNLGDNFTSTQICGWIHNNGLKKEWRSIFSKEDQKYIERNYKKMLYKEIADYLHYTEKQIRHYVEHYLDKKNRIFNDRYFQYIDTPTKAYWLGYIFADGCVQAKEYGGDTYEFSMNLQKRDRMVLEDLNEDIGGVHNISEYHKECYILDNPNISIVDMATLRVYSKNIVLDLISHNIFPNKTYKTIYPIVDKSLFIDFLRGYIDGDGCIYVNEKRNNYPTIHITSFGDEVLKYLSEKIKEYYNLHSVVYEETPRKHRLYLWGENAYKLMQLMYYDDNIQKLNRKYEKFLLLNKGSL